MDAEPGISFVIPAFNEEKYIGRCLKSINDFRPKDVPIEIIVVDNGSDDNTVGVAASFENVKVFRLPNVNVGAVRNFGAQNSSAKILAFIDADCLITEDWVETAQKLCSEQPNTVFGGGCKLREDPTWVEQYWLLEKAGQPTMPKHLIGASIVLERRTFKELGGFQEDVTSGEDSLLSDKVRESRFDLEIVPDLTVVHLGNALTLKAFFRRQIWHSENYLKKPLASLQDPVFILVILFGICALASVLSWATRHPFFWLCILATIATPAVLSAKRISRARMVGLAVVPVLPQIYSLDFIYVVARLTGVLGSFRTMAISNQKTDDYG